MAEPTDNANTSGSMWSGIFDGIAGMGASAAAIIMATNAAKGSTTPGATGAGTPAASTTTPSTGASAGNIATYVIVGLVAVVALVFGIKLLNKK
jgi:uncharacterized membrane protein YuzA (DUF378 family)